MTRRTRRYLISGLLLVCIGLVIGMLSGCGGGGGTSPQPDAGITAAEQTAAAGTNTAATDKYDEAQATSTPAQARAATVTWLKGQSSVEGAGVTSGQSTIWIKYKSGIQGLIYTETKAHLSKRALRSAVRPVTKTARRHPKALVAPKKALIISPYNWQWRELNPLTPAVDECAYLKNLLESGNEYQVDLKINETREATDVSVDDFKNLQNYGVIAVNSHGGVGPDEVVSIATGDPVVAGDTSRAADLAAGRLIIIGVSDDPTNRPYYAVTPAFIRQYSQAPQHCLVYMGACHSAETDSMASAFVRTAGADVAYFGWSKTVFTDFQAVAAEDLFARFMLDGTDATAALTAVDGSSHAYDSEHDSRLMNLGGGEVRLMTAPLRIAVSPTGWDDIGAILTGMGHSFTEVSMGDLAVGDLRSKYDVICVNCSTSANSEGPAAGAALRAFVEAGGRLYASDWAYSAVQAAFPDKLTFYSDPKCGVSQDLTGTIVADDLKSSLGITEMAIDYDLGAWVPVQSVAAGVDVLVQGNPDLSIASESAGVKLPRSSARNSGRPKEVVNDSPLAVRFTSGEGRVVYTSFHNEAQTSEVIRRFLEHLVLF